MRPDFTPDQIKASLTADRRGLLHADLHGMPARDEKTGQPKMVDQEGVPIEPDDKESARFYEFVPYPAGDRRRHSAGGGRADAANSGGDRWQRAGERQGVSRATAATWPSICTRA